MSTFPTITQKVPLRRARLGEVTLLSPGERTRLLTLRDTCDRPLVLASGATTRDPNASTRSYTLNFLSHKDQTEPSQFPCTDRRPAILEVPFVLKNVALSR